MIPLLILGALLLLLGFLLLAPVRLEVTFRQQFTAQVRYLFLCFALTSGEEETPQPGPEPPSEEALPGGGLLGKLRALLRREGLRGFLQSLQEVAQAAGDASKKLLRRLRLKKFDLYICLGGQEDAAAAAILYGKASAAAYTACGVLFGLLPCRKPSVSVDLDYGRQEDQVDFSAVLSIRVLFLLVQGLILLVRVLPFFRKLQAVNDHTERISRGRKQGETK